MCINALCLISGLLTNAHIHHFNASCILHLCLFLSLTLRKMRSLTQIRTSFYTRSFSNIIFVNLSGRGVEGYYQTQGSYSLMKSVFKKMLQQQLISLIKTKLFAALIVSL